MKDGEKRANNRKGWKGEIQCELFAFGGILYDRINSK